MRIRLKNGSRTVVLYGVHDGYLENINGQDLKHHATNNRSKGMMACARRHIKAGFTMEGSGLDHTRSYYDTHDSVQVFEYNPNAPRTRDMCSRIAEITQKEFGRQPVLKPYITDIGDGYLEVDIGLNHCYVVYRPNDLDPEVRFAVAGELNTLPISGAPVLRAWVGTNLFRLLSVLSAEEYFRPVRYCHGLTTWWDQDRNPNFTGRAITDATAAHAKVFGVFQGARPEWRPDMLKPIPSRVHAVLL